MNYYAVKDGRNIGVYKTWDECKDQIHGYSGAKYKKFKTEKEALEFIYGDELITSENKTSVYKSQDKPNVENLEIEKGTALVYVDGSFNIENFTYSYGVVFLTREGKETYSGRDDDEDLASMRNVSGELKGAMVAMEIAKDKGIKKIYLHYDYTGIEEWALGRWKTNKDGTKNYKKFYDEISKELEVEFIKVKAHSGIQYNEEADKLAKDAL